MFFPIISLLTLALAPLSMAAACHKKPHGIQHKHADVPSADVIPVSNDPRVKAACSRGRKHRGKKMKHAKVPSSTDDIVTNEPPGEEAPGEGEPSKEKPGEEVPGKEKPGERIPIKGEPGDGHKITGEEAPGKEVPGKEKPSDKIPVKAEPGDGHVPEPVSGSKFIGLGTMYRGDKYHGDEKDSCQEEDCWQQGACSFTDYHLPAGIDGSTCISEDLWENGAHCGKCITVTHEGKTLTLMVTNKTDGGRNLFYHLDMTPATMMKLVGAHKGGIGNVEWAWKECPITSPLKIKMHIGSNPEWIAVTVENATSGTAKVEVSADNGQSWVAAKRQPANMHVVERLHKDNVWVRVTSVTDKQVVVKDVQVKSGLSVPASANY
ncbi:hypothetical protein EsDP_00003542 [Epichloe bromicola]|uniref:Expansin-like CBD domain-containing protein n=1 Tax=Epichloe bromicola TaxID=79588 RepID=A0ABQ0CP19_9HYPO